MGKPLLWLALKQACSRVLYLDYYYYFSFTLMNYLTIYQQLLRSLQMARPLVQNVSTSANHLNIDLRKISNWAFQQKMVLILTLANKPSKLFSLVKPKRHPFISITDQSNKLLLKNI